MQAEIFIMMKVIMSDGLFRYIDNQGIEPNQVWCEDACHKSTDMDSDEKADLKSSTRGQSEKRKVEGRTQR